MPVLLGDPFAETRKRRSLLPGIAEEDPVGTVETNAFGTDAVARAVRASGVTQDAESLK